MNKRLLSRLMHERVPGLRSSGVYFFRGDFEHILQGVVLEYVPRGLYVWNFRFPLFDFSGPHLTYSHRLAGRRFIAKGEMSEQAIIDLILSSPEVRQTFDSQEPMSLSEFSNLLESGRFLNPHATLIRAAALILLGDESRAADVLNEPPTTLHPKDIPYWNQLKASLQQGPEAARKLLDRVRQDNLRAFGVA